MGQRIGRDLRNAKQIEGNSRLCCRGAHCYQPRSDKGAQGDPGSISVSACPDALGVQILLSSLYQWQLDEDLAVQLPRGPRNISEVRTTWGAPPGSCTLLTCFSCASCPQSLARSHRVQDGEFKSCALTPELGPAAGCGVVHNNMPSGPPCVQNNCLRAPAAAL